MAKRVFTEAERTEYREKMLAAGFDLLKQYGMTHMSVAKITEAAGIGVSTFYNFFPSKEAYVYEVLQYRRKMIPELIKMALNGKEKAGPAEARTCKERRRFQPCFFSRWRAYARISTLEL